MHTDLVSINYRELLIESFRQPKVFTWWITQILILGLVIGHQSDARDIITGYALVSFGVCWGQYRSARDSKTTSSLGTLFLNGLFLLPVLIIGILLLWSAMHLLSGGNNIWFWLAILFNCYLAIKIYYQRDVEVVTQRTWPGRQLVFLLAPYARLGMLIALASRVQFGTDSMVGWLLGGFVVEALFYSLNNNPRVIVLHGALEEINDSLTGTRQ